MTENITPDRAMRIMRGFIKLSIERAKDGDMKARQWLNSDRFDEFATIACLDPEKMKISLKNLGML